jgi:hypothetical protein
MGKRDSRSPEKSGVPPSNCYRESFSFRVVSGTTMIDRSFHVSRDADKTLTSLLRANVIGTPARSLLYQHQTVDEKLAHIAEPYFIQLKRNERVVGTCCFCKRSVRLDGNAITAFYVRYFTFNQRFRSANTIIKQNNRRSQGRLRILTQALLNGESLDVPKDTPFFHYAYVDPGNIRSMRMCEDFGFQKMRTFSTVLFTRFFPKVQADVERVTPKGMAEVRELLSGFYADYNMYSEENLFFNDYYVVRDDRKRIVAGVQVNRDRWKVLALPGKTGGRQLQLISGVPFLNRIIRQNFHFLSVEGIFVREGFETVLQQLLESMLAREGLNTILISLDVDAPLSRMIRSLDLGLAARLKKEVEGSVICYTSNMTPEQIDLLKSRPAYISGFDVT